MVTSKAYHNVAAGHSLRLVWSDFHIFLLSNIFAVY